jgi:hypothetical protein
MALYLVRWSGGRVSLVRAQSESHLMDLIDASGTPNDCTWKMYSGPVWVDFVLPGVELRKDRDGPLEVNNCGFVFPRRVFPSIEPVAGPEDEPYEEMRQEILQWAFPNLRKTLDGILDESMESIDTQGYRRGERKRVARGCSRRGSALGQADGEGSDF